MTTVERFMGKFWETAETNCWLWGAHIDRGGYGVFWLGEKNQWAHRVAYGLFCGPIPAHLTVDHLCRTRDCVNPGHLELVTPRENTLRGEGPSATNARKTHCIHGHEFTEANTHLTKVGARQCRTCARERVARRRSENAGVCRDCGTTISGDSRRCRACHCLSLVAA